MRFLTRNILKSGFYKLKMGKGLTSTLVRDGIGSLVIKGLYILLSFFMSVILARLLGASGYGDYSYIYAIISVLLIPAEFGLPTLVMRETAKHVEHQNWDIVKGVWNWSGKVVFALTISIVIGAFITYLVMGNNIPEKYRNILIFGFFVLPFISLSQLRGSALRGLKKIVYSQLPDQIIQPGLMIFLTLGFSYILKNPLTPEFAMFFQAIAAATTFLIGAGILIKYTPIELKQSSVTYQGRQWFKSAFPLVLTDGIGFLNKWISIIIAGIFVSSAEIGFYRVALQVSILALSGQQVVNLIIGPQIASLFAKGDSKRLQHLTTISTRVIFIFNLLITIFFVLFGEFFLSLVFGAEYIAAYYPILVLLAGQFIGSAAGSAVLILLMTDMEKLTIRGSLAAVISNIAINVFLIPILGLIGASIAIAVSIVISNFINWWLVRKYLRINSLAFNIKSSSLQLLDIK